MADKALVDLPSLENLADNDLLLIQHASSAYKAQGSAIRKFAEDAAQSLQRGYRGYSVSDVVAVSAPHTEGTLDSYKLKFEDGQLSPTTFKIYNGADGNSITSVYAVSDSHTAGTKDVYQINFSKSNPVRFEVYNGANGGGSFSINEDTGTLILVPPV